MNNAKIKSMKLYNNVGRIFNELREIGKDKSKLLKVEDLIKFDQLHYCGTEAVDFAIKNTQINFNKSVLEIGSGIGGPARYIAYKTRASVTALELQSDQHKIAVDLTKKCKLLKIVNHIKGDFLNYSWKNKKFDVVVRWLALYHIKDHNKLLKNCFKLIKDNGFFGPNEFLIRALRIGYRIIKSKKYNFIFSATSYQFPYFRSFTFSKKYGCKMIFNFSYGISKR